MPSRWHLTLTGTEDGWSSGELAGAERDVTTRLVKAGNQGGAHWSKAGIDRRLTLTLLKRIEGERLWKASSGSDSGPELVERSRRSHVGLGG